MQTVKLAKEEGIKRAWEELGEPKNTLGTWVHKAKKRETNSGKDEQTPETALTLVEENKWLHRQLKERDKEIKRLNELNEFLEELSDFFAASRWKYLNTAIRTPKENRWETVL